MQRPFLYEEVLRKFVETNNDTVITKEEFIISFSRLQHIKRNKMPIVIEELKKYGMIKQIDKRTIEIVA